MSYDPLAAVREAARLAALRRLHLLDSPTEAAFDRLTNLAARIIHAPAALVSLVDMDRQFFKSSVGVAEPWASRRETPLSYSFCQHVVASKQPLIIEDARAHPLVQDSPAILELDVIAYAGIPLTTSDGHVLGSFCVIDSQPRTWTPDELATLGDLAASVMTEIELRGDIIERTRLEERFAKVFHASPVSITITGLADGRFIDVNESFLSLMGYQRDEVVGRTAAELGVWVHQEDRARVIQALREQRLINSAEIPFRAKSGQIVETLASFEIIEFGDELCILSMTQDITERQRAEAALRRSLTTNRGLLNAIPDTMLRIKRDGTLVHFKAAKGVALEGSLTPLVGQPIRSLFPAEVLPQMEHCIEQALQQGEIQVFEYSLSHGGIVHDYEARVVASGDDEVLAIMRDMTERKRVERLKNEFVAIVSHELRTPLTSIRGSLGLLSGGVAGELAPRARAMVEIAYNNSERLVRLINDMLDIEKIESGKLMFNLKPTELLPLIKQALDANQAYAAQLKVNLALEDAIPQALVNVDSDRLMQVFTNLLSNAAKFSPANDTVVVSMARRDGRVRVSISDHGPGIPEEFHGRMFQKFAQADSSDTRQKGGTGLGLSIAKAIVDRLGGQLGFESRAGAGTTFYVDLPEWRPASTPDAQQLPLLPHDADDSPRPPRRAGARPRILHVEDDPDILKVVASILQNIADLDPATSLHAARQKLLRETFDLVIIDMNLPDGCGLEVLPHLTQPARPPIPAIVFSIEDVGVDVASGIAATVVKSRTTNEDLLETVTVLVGGT
jgi:PAS domain S-box-containing protein